MLEGMTGPQKLQFAKEMFAAMGVEAVFVDADGNPVEEEENNAQICTTRWENKKKNSRTS